MCTQVCTLVDVCTRTCRQAQSVLCVFCWVGGYVSPRRLKGGPKRLWGSWDRHVQGPGLEEGERGVHGYWARCRGRAGAGAGFSSPELGPFPLGCLSGFQSGLKLLFVEMFVLGLKPAAETLVPVKDRPPRGGREGHGQGRLRMAASEVFLSGSRLGRRLVSV